jgi:hypothetical protein
LSVKGLEANDFIKNRSDKFLILSLTNKKNNYNNFEVSVEGNYTKKNKGVKVKELFCSVSLIAFESVDQNPNIKNLYDLILQRLEDNKDLIKEGGLLDIYYLLDSSKLKYNFGEEKKYEIKRVIYLNKVINNNKKLLVNIHLFSFDFFFKEFITYDSLFNSENKIDRKINKLWSFPFLIIEDLSLSTVISLFKVKKLDLHGMSMPWRHKLSPLQKNLSNFLYITNLDENIQNSDLIFKVKIYTNNRIDKNLYKEIFNTYLNSVEMKNKIENTLIDLKDHIENNPNIAWRDQNYNKGLLIYLQIQLNKLEKQFISPITLLFLLKNLTLELEAQLRLYQQKSVDELLRYDNTIAAKLINIDKFKIEIAEQEKSFEEYNIN